MLDYQLLQALAAVVEQGGFEQAARALGLSQSAVSQRVKLLEARVGAPVLLRATPPTPTDTGKRLLNHVQDRKSTRLNSSHVKISYAVFCLKKKRRQHLIGDMLNASR